MKSRFILIPLLVLHAMALCAWPSAVLASDRPVVPLTQRPNEAHYPLRTCSFDLPICVHAPNTVHPQAVLTALADAENAIHALDALQFPRPIGDERRGGSDALDLYLDQNKPWPQVIQDIRPPGQSHDISSAFGFIQAPIQAGGCVTASQTAYAIAYATALRLDAGAGDGELSMLASYLASLIAPCATTELMAVDSFQRTPYRALTSSVSQGLDGAMLFPWYLDDVVGRGTPALVILSLMAISTQKTTTDALYYHNEPDIFDALRDSLPFRGGDSMDSMLLDFAVMRAFVGSRSDDMHLSDVAKFGAFGRIWFEWVIAGDSLPRRVAPLYPVESTGMTYIWLDLGSAPKTLDITFVADWELPALFRWALVKVNRQGVQVGRVDVAGIFGSTHAERTIVGLQDLAGLLIVGVNAGSTDRSRPFDPDDDDAPHGYTVWLSK